MRAPESEAVPGRSRRVPAWLRPLLDDGLPALLATLLPCACALCGMGSRAVLCPGCHDQVLRPDHGSARCALCANPLAVADARWPCAACQRHRPAYDATIVAADYTSPLDQLVLRLKFGGALALAPWMGKVLAEAVRAHPALPLPDLMCPVPLGPRRLVERGYNQALEIARTLSAVTGAPFHSTLAVRARDTTAQSLVAPSARRANIRHAFVVAPDALALVRDRHIGVVDDVMTSGATLDELAATFKRFGAARVSNFVFARTPPH